ncbi:MAG: hypothetical protein QXQ66_08165 [Candidatus Hadarchaeum sp.]|uniref:hypothetical protein n=1 Tax=Candidatus Hadarchaeum sp. TaxID=2883567 RepID=UPI00317D7B77
MFLPEWTESVIAKLKSCSLPAFSSLSEEEQYAAPTFVEEDCGEPIEAAPDDTGVIEVRNPRKDLEFQAFLDGVQRTILWRRIPLPSGVLVPIHIAHIGAGLLLRDKNGRLQMDPTLTATRLLLLGPFEGLRRSGLELKELDNGEAIVWDTDERTFGFPAEMNEWILCDTTFRGTEHEREKQSAGALIGDTLFNEGLVRSRAQGRVATLRQRLEFAVLARFRGKEPEKWVLVDGPLFFIDKWRRRAARLIGAELGEQNEGLLEDKLLRNAVGLIKSHRLRPKNPAQIMKMGPTQRSLVVPLSHEVDLKGRRETPDEEGTYGGLHLTWYTRLRCCSRPPYGLLGLIRLDIHRASLPGVVRGDALNQECFQNYRPLIDAITWATWRERWPAFRRVDDYRSATEPYPIWQVERILKAMAFPRRFLAHLIR